MVLDHQFIFDSSAEQCLQLAVDLENGLVVAMQRFVGDVVKKGSQINYGHEWEFTDRLSVRFSV